MIHYIYNSEGECIAFKVDKNIFLIDTLDWFGWVDEKGEVYSPTGEYIGFVSEDDRILCEVPKPLRPLRNAPPLPPLPSLPPLPPLRPPYPPLPPNLIDVFSDEEF